MTTSEPASAIRGVWWLVLIRGILAILFGLFALFAPGTALLALVFVFGAYAIIDGITAIIAGIRHRKEESHWGWHVFQGVVSLIAGIIAFTWPGVTVLAILFVIAFWSIVNGVGQLVESFTMRKMGAATWGWMLAGGVVSVLFGIVLLAWPGAGLVTLLWVVGIFSIVFGVILVVWALRLRRAVDARGGVGQEQRATTE
ncbi:HdeD family acid-resistance protein [Pseudonocardia xinjiangensis]|uniref:HdeD family acid-resistance protein n=1 Tax=Pseudonocardia xinjiangensis TaxID=75289 RepID=UPI003D89E4D3